MRKYTLLLLLSSLFVCSSTWAGTVTGLYKMEVPVIDREAGTRSAGIVTALRLVLVRLSGDRNAGQASGARTLFKNAQRYVQQYGYTRHDETPEQQYLWVQFDQSTLERDIRQLGLPVWGSTRPSVLAWLAVEQDGQRRFLSADSPYQAMLMKHFERRGIPLVLPRLDAEDQARLSAQDLLPMKQQVLIEASRRYGTEAVLSGVIKQSASGLWEADWRLLVEGDRKNWFTEGDVPELMIEEGSDSVADNLAVRFANTGLSGKAGWQLLVDNITSVDDYARVQQYLASLDAVTRVEVRQMDSQSATFYVEAHGGAQAVSQVIALGRTLSPITPQRFQLLPRVIEH